jgi:putative copper export protein
VRRRGSRPTPPRAYPGRVTSTAVRRAPTLARPANPWWLVLAGPFAVVVAVLAVLAAGGFSGAFAAIPGFSDPGALVRYGTPVVTVLTELSVALTLGSLVLAAVALPAGEAVRRALGLSGVAAATWAVLSVLQVVLRYSSISGTPVTAETFGDQLGLFVSQVSLGRNYLAVVVVAAVTSALALAVRSATGALWTALVALLAIALQANTGHAAGAASHELAVSSMFLHLAGAALWVGGLGTLAVVRVRGGLGRQDFAAAVSRYSAIALWCYVAVAVSGVANATIRVDTLAGLTTDYGILLLTKVALIVVLGVVGFAHRELVVRRLAGPTTPARPGGRGGGPGTAAGSTDRAAGAASDGAKAAGVVGQRGATGGQRGADATRWLFWRLVAVELAIMGAVSGVAVALGSTAPPVPQTEFVDPTAAEIVTGHPLPPEPTFALWFTEWRWDLLPAFACGAALVVYLGWVRRLARRGDRWPVGRTVSWCVGIVVLFWVTSGGPAMYGHVLFSAHMVQHMVLAMVVPIFLVLAAPVTLLLRAVPPMNNFGGIRCSPTGEMTLADALRISCNSAFADLAVTLGDDAMRDQAEAFGFDDDSLTIPMDVTASRYPTEEQSAPDDLARAGIGQGEVKATPLQMAMVSAAIANDGVLMAPYTVETIRNPDLEVVQQTEPRRLRTSVSPSTADQLTQMMLGVVQNGSGTAAQIPGVQVAGKTGTAENDPALPPHAWFTAFAPADDPQVAVAVIVENGGSSGSEATGGAVAAPIARAVMEAVLNG